MLFIPAWKPERRRALIESLFKQASTLARLQSGPVAQQLSPLAEALLNEQYPPARPAPMSSCAEYFSGDFHAASGETKQERRST